MKESIVSGVLKKLRSLQTKSREIHGGGDITDKVVRPTLSRVVAELLGTYQEGIKKFAGEIIAHVYSRISNKTVEALEKKIVSIWGGGAALATASGMAAIDVTYRYLTRCGDHIVVSPEIYGGVDYYFRHILSERDGREVTFVENPHDPDSWLKCVKPNTKAFHIENPSNPLARVFDIRPIVSTAHSHNIEVVVDHTLATDVLYDPFEWGADWVVQSITKYIGDGLYVAGAVRNKNQEKINLLRKEVFRNTGACLSPDNAYGLIYNLETISERMNQHSANAEKMAEFLAGHKYVERVHYPTIGPRAEFNRKIMPKGFGGLLSFDLKGDESNVHRFIDNVKLFDHAANIGEARSLIIGPWGETHGCMEPKDRLAAGIQPTTVRLSLGREDFSDLKEDIIRNGFSKLKFKKSQRP